MLNGNTGDHSEKLRTSSADVDEQTINTVEGRLANLNDITKPKENEEVSEVDDTEDPNLQENEEVSEADDDSTLDDKDDKEKDSTEQEGEEDDGKKTVEIPHAYEQAAMRSGWSKEDIDELVATDPEKADKILKNIYNSVNQASREWSALGRARLNQAKTGNKPDADKTGTDEFTGVDIEKLKKEYENDPLIDGVIAPLNDALKQMSKKMSVLETSKAETNNDYRDIAAERSLQQQIDNFFSSDSMKPYSEFYGSLETGQGVESLTGVQRKNRWDVLTEADAIIAGHAAIGQQIDADEAMARAHLLITEPLRSKIIRDGIKESVKKRNNSLTLRPSKGTKTSSSSKKFSPNSKPRNRKELENSVSQKLNKVFSNS